MKKIRVESILSILITIFILLGSFLLLFGPKKEFAENENRYLAKFPILNWDNIWNGTFMKGIDAYFGDHFLSRDTFVSMKTNVEKLLGKNEINGVVLGENGYLLENYEKDINTDKIVDILNAFHHKLNYINMDIMLVPTSISINTSKIPLIHSSKISQFDTIETYYNGIRFNHIDLKESFIDANTRHQLYYKLDHHWTSFGAYYAYREYCKHNQIEPLSMEQFEIKKISDDFKGTLYSKVGDYTLKGEEMHIFIPKQHHYEVTYIDGSKTRKSDTLYEASYLEKKDKYSYFLDNNHGLITVENKDIDNGKELLIIKDSYANSFVPFIVNHFEKVHIIDPRFFGSSISTYVKNNDGIRDILFLYNMNTIDKDLGIVTVS